MKDALLESGADPNAAAAGYSALHWALLRRDTEVVRALLAKGADPNMPLRTDTPFRRLSPLDLSFHPAWIGATPYWLAAKFAELDIMRVLAAARADTRSGIEDGTTPLMATLMAGQGQGDRRECFQTEVQIAAMLT